MWEPPDKGYTRSDGKLILFNGNEIDDPAEHETREEAEAREKQKKMAAKLEAGEVVEIVVRCAGSDEGM